MHLIAKVITILRAKFHCNRLKTVQDIQDYTSLIILAHSVELMRGMKKNMSTSEITFVSGQLSY